MTRDGPQRSPTANGRLPVRLSRLVGREAQVAELVALLEDERLITLTGPGGAGKSRLAVAVAAESARRYPGGVWWVPLATLTEPARLADTVAEALEVADAAGMPVIDSIIAAVSTSRALLVFDNCEHLLDQAATLVERLLGSCPGLTVLATSQQSLTVPGELSWATPPLVVPAEGEADVTRFESVRLFVERARGARAGFALNGDDAEAVGRICRRLDGIPLAIELAACRVNVLTVQQIDARLDSCMQVLVGGSRTAAPRHRAIQATMDWSYRLLNEPERRLFARLSVLSGTFSLDAVESLAGEYIDDPLDVLAELVAKSLVVAQQHPLGMRYRLLRVVRVYARSKLIERGESLATQAGHARFFVAQAERAEAAPPGPERHEWLDRLDADRENLRTAHSWCVHGGSAEGALRLASAVWRYCVLRGHYRDGRQWLESALSSSGHVPADLRAKALVAAGRLAHLECDYDIAVQRLTDGLRGHTELGDNAGMAAALEVLGSVARERGDYAEALGRHQRSLELTTANEDQHGIARALNYLGFAAWLNRDSEAAQRYCARSRMIFAEEGDAEGTAWALLNLGSAQLYRDEIAQADALLTEALAVCRKAGFPEGIAWSLNQLGTVALRIGDPRRAERALLQSLRIHQTLGDRWRMTSVLDGLAAAASVLDDPHAALRLLAAATALRESIGTPVPSVERPDRERTLARVRPALGPDRFARAWAACTATSPRTVIAELLDAQTAASSPIRSGARPNRTPSSTRP